MPAIAAVLMAAGESTRMGRPKALLPWEGRPLVAYHVAALESAGASPIIVVLGHDPEAIVPHVRRSNAVRVVVNADYAQGKTTSIKRGLREVPPDAAGVLLLAVDQPRPPELLARLVEEHVTSGALITNPTYQGRGGHPLLFHRALIPELESISEETEGVRAVMRAHQADVRAVAVGTPAARFDLNTPEDYERALVASEQQDSRPRPPGR